MESWREAERRKLRNGSASVDALLRNWESDWRNAEERENEAEIQHDDFIGQINLLISLITLLSERTEGLRFNVSHETADLLQQLGERYVHFRLRYESGRHLRGETTKS